MANLKEVRTRIQSVKSTQQITKAMKMVAASKLRKAQDGILQMRPYAAKLFGILRNTIASIDGEHESKYSIQREDTKNVLVIVITSDRGLCGAFNTNSIKAGLSLIANKYSKQERSKNLWILPIGGKAFDYFSKREYQVIDNYYGLFNDLTFDRSKEVAEFAMLGFLNEDYDSVEIVYNEFKNVSTQILKTEQFLPIEKDAKDKNIDNTDYIFEPSVDFIIKEMIPRTLKVQLYKAILESNASEHGARMTAMEQATENAGELLKDLKLIYNRSRQAAITNEILEIVGGAEALSG